jgi:hypothetical protein
MFPMVTDHTERMPQLLMATLAIKLAPLPPPLDRSSPRKMPQIAPTAQVVKITSTPLNLSKKAALTKIHRESHEYHNLIIHQLQPCCGQK